MIFYDSSLERGQRESIFVNIFQVGRGFTFKLQVGDGKLEYCWQKSWGEMNGLGSSLAGKAISTWGGLGVGVRK